MKIKNHFLFIDGIQVDYKPTPNKGGKYIPQYLLMHYTAVTTAQSTINWFLNPNARTSAHLLIGRDGAITQFAPFNIVTWHAGVSNWAGLSGLNQYAIGIELVNGGRLSKAGDKWISPVDKKTVPADEVMIEKHCNEQKESAWHEFSGIQMELSAEVGALLIEHYNLKDVLGHDEVAPFRKSDPGPAFPMNSYRARVMGRENDLLDRYVTATTLNIRSGAGTVFNTISKPLPKGTPVLILKKEGNWSFVEVLEPFDNNVDLEGWVFSKYLIKE